MVYRILGQSNPIVTTLTDVYTVVSPIRSAVLSTITIAERGGVATTFRISIAKGGATDSLEQYIAYDTPISANQALGLTYGITLAQGDVVRVYSGVASLSFGIFGVENG